MNAAAYLGIALALACANASAQTLIVFAAASLKNALDAVAAEWRPAGTEHARPGGAGHARPGGTEHARPGGAEHARPGGAEHARPAGTEHARPGGTEHARPGGAEHARPGGTEHARPGGAEHARPGGAGPSIAYGASSMLARQIENGAPAQLFISADSDWMDYLAARNLLRSETRRNLLGNSLVLVVPADSRLQVELRPGVSLAALLGNGRLAVADPASVPAGKYARAALEKLGAWPAVSARLAPAENVRAALMLVARGEAPMGIVYGSDAMAEPKVRVAARIDPALHPVIVYPAALIAAASRQGSATPHPGAAEFLAYLQTPAARRIFVLHGFTPL